jgi:hypothetical protein
MPYIERKKINGKYYLYLYETYRVPGEKYPKRRMIRYLGIENHFNHFKNNFKRKQTKEWKKKE